MKNCVQDALLRVFNNECQPIDIVQYVIGLIWVYNKKESVIHGVANEVWHPTEYCVYLSESKTLILIFACELKVTWY